jgi:hypothetical protein
MVAQNTMDGMPAPRANKTKNLTDPRGVFGAFLEHWLDKNRKSLSEFAGTLGLTPRAVGKWREGTSGPSFDDLDRVAHAMGFSDFGKCYSAAVRFSQE